MNYHNGGQTDDTRNDSTCFLGTGGVSGRDQWSLA